MLSLLDELVINTASGGISSIGNSGDMIADLVPLKCVSNWRMLSK